MPRIGHDKFYLSALKRYGFSAKALNWLDEERQYKRFEIILDLLKKHKIDRLSVVDCGCGFGDFYLFSKYNGVEFKRYLGYDIIPIFVKEARRRTKQAIEIKDVLVEPLEKADFYITSGMLNTFNRFETFLFIKRALKASKKGIIFNLLKGDKSQSKIFNYFLPREIESIFNKDKYGINLIEGYLKNDFTFEIVKKNIDPVSSTG